MSAPVDFGDHPEFGRGDKIKITIRTESDFGSSGVRVSTTVEYIGPVLFVKDSPNETRLQVRLGIEDGTHQTIYVDKFRLSPSGKISVVIEVIEKYEPPLTEEFGFFVREAYLDSIEEGSMPTLYQHHAHTGGWWELNSRSRQRIHEAEVPRDLVRLAVVGG